MFVTVKNSRLVACGSWEFCNDWAKKFAHRGQKALVRRARTGEAAVYQRALRGREWPIAAAR